MKKYYLTILFFFLFPSVVYANLVWPALYMVVDIYAWRIILLSVLIESFVVWIITRFKFIKSVIVSVIMNAVSAACGVFLLPVAGIVWELIYSPLRELIFHYGTFHWSTWITTFIIAVLINVFLEGLTITWVFRYRLKWLHVFYLFLANALTIILAATMVQQKHDIW